MKGKDWSYWKNSSNETMITKNGINLLSKMLEFDHEVRITAHEALKHPFFNEVQDMFN